MAQFNTYLPLLQQVEGGYTDNPNDNGNWTGGKKGIGHLVGTNKGVSAPVYAKWIGRTPTVADMKGITGAVANTIFKQWYWDKVNASRINDQSVANIIVDHAVNAGAAAAGKLVQKVLNEKFRKNIRVDGGIGNETITAINSVVPYQLHEAIKEARLDFYKSINQPTFIAGWTNRLQEFVYDKPQTAGFGAIGIFVIASLIYWKIKST